MTWYPAKRACSSGSAISKRPPEPRMEEAMAVACARSSASTRARVATRRCAYTAAPNVTTAATRMTPYHVSSVRRMLAIDDVPLPAPRLDEIPAELAADIRNVHVHDVRERVVVLVVDVLVDRRARDELAAVEREQFDERVLLRR